MLYFTPRGCCGYACVNETITAPNCTELPKFTVCDVDPAGVIGPLLSNPPDTLPVPVRSVAPAPAVTVVPVAPRANDIVQQLLATVVSVSVVLVAPPVVLVLASGVQDWFTPV